MKDFSPDWSSPPSDTIKDILEERGENYDDFIVEANHWSGSYYIVEGIESVFDGELEMPPSIALYLSERLGSTEDFWLKRSALYRAKKKSANFLKYQEENDYVIEIPKLTLIQAISSCLSAQVKREDAPCSSETHLNSAIAALYELIPDYTPSCKDTEDALEWALKEGRVLRGEEK